MTVPDPASGNPNGGDLVRGVLGDLLNLPPKFLDYLVQYQALNGLPIPLSQVTGYQTFISKTVTDKINALSTSLINSLTPAISTTVTNNVLASLKNNAGTINHGSVFPVSPSAGDVFFLTVGTTTMLPFQFDGSNWFSSAFDFQVFAGANGGDTVSGVAPAEQGAGTLHHPIVYAADATGAGCGIQARLDVVLGCNTNATTYAELGVYTAAPSAGVTWLGGTQVSTGAFFPVVLSSGWVDTGVAASEVGLSLACWNDGGGGNGLVEAASAQVRFNK